VRRFEQNEHKKEGEVKMKYTLVFKRIFLVVVMLGLLTSTYAAIQLWKENRRYKAEQVIQSEKKKELRKQARSRVSLLSDRDKQRLISLEKLIDEASPEEGAKLENSIFAAIQSRGDWIFHGNSTKPLNNEGLIVDPVELIALIQDKAKLQEAMTEGKYHYQKSLQRYFGEYEGAVIANLKIIS